VEDGWLGWEKAYGDKGGFLQNCTGGNPTKHGGMGKSVNTFQTKGNNSKRIGFNQSVFQKWTPAHMGDSKGQ